jgi:uncharacterized cofD-like protein
MCLAALADAEPLMREVLQYRFPGPGDGAEGVNGADGAAGDARGLAGHALGNLLIAAVTAVEGGDFEDGVRAMNRILAVRGRVLPVSSTPLTLHAKLADGSVVDGQSMIMRTNGIERVWVTPDSVLPSAEALAAIAEADLIVLGPGSLYTSLLPSLLIPAIRDAILAADAGRVFVCNVATQVGETAGLDLGGHVEALLAHTGPGLIDAVLANNTFTAQAPPDWPAEPVRLRWPPNVAPLPRLVLDDVVDPTNAHHHDPTRLAAALIHVLESEPRSRRRSIGRTA